MPTQILAALALVLACANTLAAGPAVSLPADATALETLAAREVVRYLYLRTGQLMPIGIDAPDATVAIGRAPDLGREDYRLRTIDGRLHVAGGSDVGTLYGAYRLAEHFGIRFGIHGDTIPDRQIPLSIPDLNETGRPAFAIRGLLPFHDFPEGPDWWSIEDWQAYIGQLPKVGMNFVGLHAYDNEPTVWLRPASLRCTYATSHSRPAPDYIPMPTSAYACGARLLFDRDDFGPETSGSEQTAAMLRKAFTLARRLGVRTCVGHEMGGEPLNYEAVFRRAADAYPIDYYWLWSREPWTWETPAPAQVAAVTRELAQAQAAAAKLRVPFQLASSGWVLGPPGDRAAFDRLLAKASPMASLSRQFGAEPIDPAFAAIRGRPLWAIPWLEGDPTLTVPQLLAGRMQRDAADVQRAGCTGLIGLHWRTRVIAPNVAALAGAAWSRPFSYEDWARGEFGDEAAREIGGLFDRLDGRLPAPCEWAGGPGRVAANRAAWAEVGPRYAFVEHLAVLRPRINDAGNLERFDFWLDNFRAMRAMGQVGCALGRLDVVMDELKASRDRVERRRLAQEALPLRQEASRLWAEMLGHYLAAARTTGDLGTIANLEQQSRLRLLVTHDRLLVAESGGALPGVDLPTAYAGPPHLIVPTVRGSLEAGEPLRLTALVLAEALPREASIYWRPLGRGEFRRQPMRHVARGVWRGEVPSPDPAGVGLEYRVEVVCASGQHLVFPATAPAINQTVVVIPAQQSIEPRRP